MIQDRARRTAWAHRSEALIGQFVRSLGAATRDSVVVATKLFYPVGEGEAGLSRRNVLASCDASLARLGLDYIDLLQIHRWDPDVPIEETMGALDELVRSGRVRFIGAANSRAWQLAKANFSARAVGGAEFVSIQAHYNLLHREDERELLPLCIDQGIGVLPWSPLARGRLARAAPATPSGSVRSGSDDTIATLYGAAPDPVLDAVAAAATQSGLTAAQVAIAWLAAKPGVVAPLLGVTRAGQLEQAVAAVEHEMQAEQIAALECAYTPRAYADLPWTARNLTVLRAAR